MDRFISLDTETTGLNRGATGRKLTSGHRIIEIAALEIIGNRITGEKFHSYIHPDNTKITEEAFNIHGINEEYLSDKPTFHEVQDEFINFILGSTLIMHNANFDIAFLDKELYLIDSSFPLQRFLNPKLPFICTKDMSGHLSLDDACKKYKIDNSERKVHGALIDAELTAKCYLAMKERELMKRSDVMECLKGYYRKYSEKEESVLIKEIMASLEEVV